MGLGLHISNIQVKLYEKPLQGIRVIEFGNFIAGPFCGMLLADMGAEVIKIEPLSGDLARAIPPIIDGKSLHYDLNRNKKV